MENESRDGGLSELRKAMFVLIKFPHGLNSTLLAKRKKYGVTY
jgi:hypothetical protein